MALGYKIFAMDAETTGVDKNADEMHEIAYKIIGEDGNIIVSRHLFMKPAIDLEKMSETQVEELMVALAVSHKTLAQVMSYPPAEDAYHTIYSDLASVVDAHNPNDKLFVLGYNVNFDIMFLKRFMERFMSQFDMKLYLGSFLWWKRNEPKLDVYPALPFYCMKFMVALPDYRLSTVCEFFGIDLKNAHDADADLVATIKLTKHFMQSFNKIPKLNAS